MVILFYLLNLLFTIMLAGKSKVKITIKEVHIHLESVDNVLVGLLSNLGELIMATKDEVLEAIAVEKQQVADAVAALTVRIEELIAAGNGATAADLEEIKLAVEGII